MAIDTFDHSEENNLIAALRPNESEKERFMRLQALSIVVDRHLNAKRCAECVYLKDGKCRKNKNQIIPEEYLYAPNPCNDFELEIPF